MFSPFNWKEIELLISRIAPEIEGLYVEKIFIPSRPRFSGGFIKSEWALRLSSRQAEWDYVFSSRARRPYFALYPKKVLSSAKEGSHAGFDLSLNKELKGLKLKQIRALSRERAVLLEFTGGGGQNLRLLQMMIPAVPETLLLKDDTLIATTKTSKDAVGKPYSLPDGTRAPPELSIREEFKNPSFSLQPWIDDCLNVEAFTERKQNLEREMNSQKKALKENLRRNETSLKEAKSEAPWKHYGDLLKGSLSAPSPMKGGIRKAMDYETGEEVDVPCDPKLDLKTQIEKFYSLSKRQSRRIEEAQNRIIRFKTSLDTLTGAEESLTDLGASDFEGLSHLEKNLGISLEFPNQKERPKPAGVGKLYFSGEGLAIWAGRDRHENLEVTFKIGRGNDIWMHARGRTSAHVIIQIPPKKSASLDSLLDAAHVLLHSSGGKDWGKIDIDYTFRKFVKKIKDSTEVTYTQNKTLSVTFEPKRMARLLESANKSL